MRPLNTPRLAEMVLRVLLMAAAPVCAVIFVVQSL